MSFLIFINTRAPCSQQLLQRSKSQLRFGHRYVVDVPRQISQICPGIARTWHRSTGNTTIGLRLCSDSLGSRFHALRKFLNLLMGSKRFHSVLDISTLDSVTFQCGGEIFQGSPLKKYAACSRAISCCPRYIVQFDHFDMRIHLNLKTASAHRTNLNRHKSRKRIQTFHTFDSRLSFEGLGPTHDL